MLNAEQLVERQKKLVSQDEEGWLTQRRDFYKFCAPYRDPRDLEPGVAGPRRTTEIWDATAVAATYRGAGRLQRALTPDFENWIELMPGPLVRADQADEWKRFLSDVTKVARALIHQGGASTALGELYQDIWAGDGALMVVKGDEEEPVKFIALPPEHVQTDDDSTGRTYMWLYRQEVEAREILKRWPKATLPKDLAKLIADKPDDREPLLLTCERTGARQYAFKVVWIKQKAAIWEETLRTSPFITPRFFKAPGQRRGAGPALLAMPTIKTLNKAVEFELKAAAFAILGAWMTTDDGVYNPRTSVLSPGGMIKVDRTGGPRGASMVRLPIPENFDLSRIVTNDLRLQIREIMYDNELPSEAGAVRSPTEIVERLKRLAKDIAGAFGRLHAELIVPLVQRVIDIADQWGLLPRNASGSGFLPIDNLLVRAQVISPLAHAQMLEDIEKAVRWFELMTVTIGPDEAKAFVDTDRFGEFLHEKLGADITLVRSPEQRAQLRAELRQAAVAAYQEAAAKAANDDFRQQQQQRQAA